MQRQDFSFTYLRESLFWHLFPLLRSTYLLSYQGAKMPSLSSNCQHCLGVGQGQSLLLDHLLLMQIKKWQHQYWGNASSSLFQYMCTCKARKECLVLKSICRSLAHILVLSAAACFRQRAVHHLVSIISTKAALYFTPIPPIGFIHPNHLLRCYIRLWHHNVIHHEHHMTEYQHSKTT